MELIKSIKKDLKITIISLFFKGLIHHCHNYIKERFDTSSSFFIEYYKLISSMITKVEYTIFKKR